MPNTKTLVLTFFGDGRTTIYDPDIVDVDDDRVPTRETPLCRQIVVGESIVNLRVQSYPKDSRDA